MIKIIEVQSPLDKSKIAEQILRKLPDWFGIESGIAKYINGVKDNPFFVAKIDEDIVGFISVEDHNKYSSEIYVMGVLPENRGNGIGGKLVEHVWRLNKELGKKFLLVKTLDESAEDSFYEETRKFYLKMGFLPLFSNIEIWGEENPCLIMVRDE